MFRELKVLLSAQQRAPEHRQKPSASELGIAENNLFIQLAAMGLSHQLFGARLLSIGTLYDPFIARGLDALNYACYRIALAWSWPPRRRDAGAGRPRASRASTRR